MREPIYQKIGPSSNVHMQIQKFLDQFKRAYQLKNEVVPDNVLKNIDILRDLVHQIENVDVLLDSYKKHLLTMRTCKEVFSFIWPFDCALCTYTFMTLAINGMLKDTKISNLESENKQLRESLSAQERNHLKQIDDLKKESDQRVVAMQGTMQSDIQNLHDCMQSIRQEVTLLKGANQVLESRLIESQARIKQVDNENMRLVHQLGVMQDTIDGELAAQADQAVMKG